LAEAKRLRPGHWLRRPVERVPLSLLEPVEVREPDLRPLVAARDRVDRLPRIDVDSELVEYRPVAVQRAVGDAHVVDEADGRRRAVVLRVAVVVAARRDG